MDNPYGKYRTLSVRKVEHVLTLTLNKPPLNAVNEEMDRELAEVFVDIGRDADVRVVVLASNGRAFSAGGDLDDLIRNGRARDYASWLRSMRNTRRLLMAMLDLEAPIIARVHGHAVGLGATLAFFSDIVVAAESAKFSDPHVRIGLSAGDGGAIVWQRLAGLAVAKRYLLTGESLSARRAFELGLVAELASDGEVDLVVERISQSLAKLSPKAVSTTKRLLNIPILRDVVETMDANLGLETMSRLTEDHLEATLAVKERRDANIKGQ